MGLEAGSPVGLGVRLGLALRVFPGLAVGLAFRVFLGLAVGGALVAAFCVACGAMGAGNVGTGIGGAVTGEVIDCAGTVGLPVLSRSGATSGFRGSDVAPEGTVILSADVSSPPCPASCGRP
ncbi:hypothetical protein Aros01_09461 [Streptosporangium roseum]